MNQESLNMEYKLEYVDDIKKTVIAFANTDGGSLWIGVEDDGSVVGVRNGDEVLLKAVTSIRDSIKPDVTLFTTCERLRAEGKDTVRITVQKGTSCPYYLSGKGIRPEGVFVRQGAATVPATEAAILKMIKESAGDSYEEVRSLNQNLTFDALEKEFSAAGIKSGYSQMKSLHLIGEDDLYTNLGLLLSDQCGHTIKLALFEGNTKEVLKDRYEFSGSLFQQIRECYSLIDRYNRTSSRFDGLTRIDSRDYPATAIREALLNAVVHRDYSYSSSILISIYDNRMEIAAIGGLVKGISRDDILLGISILRNRNLGDVFYRLKLIEAFGTGIPKMMESYEQSRSYLRPKIEITDHAFKVTLYQMNDPVRPGEMIRENYRYFTEGEQKIIDMFICAKLIRRSDVEQELSISQPMAVRYIKGLLNKEVLEKVGNGKNVRYRLKEYNRPGLSKQ